MCPAAKQVKGKLSAGTPGRHMEKEGGEEQRAPLYFGWSFPLLDIPSYPHTKWFKALAPTHLSSWLILF